MADRLELLELDVDAETAKKMEQKEQVQFIRYHTSMLRWEHYRSILTMASDYLRSELEKLSGRGETFQDREERLEVVLDHRQRMWELRWKNRKGRIQE